MTTEENDVFGARTQLELNGKTYTYYRLQALEEGGVGCISGLPYSIKILLESVLRQYDGKAIKKEHIENLSKWGTKEMKENMDVPFKPARIVLQDFTGVPVVVDIASLRKAMHDMGGDPKRINPEIQVDLVIDHAEQVDKFGTPDALKYNVDRGFELNYERYEFFKWATNSIDNFRAVPPSTAIIHQANLEYLTPVVHGVKDGNGEYLAFPDTCFGTDSHTPMINGIGVVGWGVGGIEAEAGMLGQPSCFPVPEVIGIRLNGTLPAGTTGTDLALYMTNLLRKKKVVGKFVEFFGKGVANLSLADRATVANMSPENGATISLFPIDKETLHYLRLSGRTEEQVQLVEAYCKANGLFYTSDSAEAVYTAVIDVNLADIETSLAGPKRPQDLIRLSELKETFKKALTYEAGNHGYGLAEDEINKFVQIRYPNGSKSTLKTGAIVLAAITSCTNTSNPNVMIGAGLLAKKAVERGLSVPSYVKTSLSPGSKVVTDYLRKAGLLPFLEKLGFYLVGYGCTTCVGNSGPLPEEIGNVIVDHDMIVSSVLSGNRNFEGRIHPLIKANFLASPPLVVAYAIAGTVDINLRNEPLGTDKEGKDVYLADIWPTEDEVQKVIAETVTPDLFEYQNEHMFTGNKDWNNLKTSEGLLYEWEEKSTYLQNPPFFERISLKPREIVPLQGLRVLAKLGDSITTDHISPAGGTIPLNSVAGKYLMDQGVKADDLSSYGARRGNHHVMMRGGFANIRLRNQITPGTEGGVTTYFPTREVMSIYDASMRYQQDGTGLVIIAGIDYGMGSSRDWAAKATQLLGVKAVIAQSFERIHRSNLALMGVLPLQFKEGESADTAGLTGRELFEIDVFESLYPHQKVKVTAVDENGIYKHFEAIVRFDSDVEIDYYRHGGVLQMVLRDKLSKHTAT
ncbi:aconitate hydratase [Paenibacillus sp. 1_12]|uniref:aconitate hydratase AcnA n=1 Tax=Paenibacillus sp. 1_12 TaxID=1566278 RepID=UPI0008EA49AD|nr:aconitate hydratase AcnA [Paenibacillus sp. 1_12]SFK73637.1 aconitate hydratase [Paenibacillus sp. 1_12]